MFQLSEDYFQIKQVVRIAKEIAIFRGYYYLEDFTI